MKKYGLRKKPTYDSLIDYLQNKQQEPTEIIENKN